MKSLVAMPEEEAEMFGDGITDEWSKPAGSSPAVDRLASIRSKMLSISALASAMSNESFQPEPESSAATKPTQGSATANGPPAK